MKKGLKNRWLAALRSGKYAQCRATLKKTDGGKDSFCCLGVLCDISPSVKRRVYGSEVLGNEALAYAGFSSEQEDTLTYMNDGECGHKKKTFKGIATWIEKNL
jgi:hypothetical protein